MNNKHYVFLLKDEIIVPQCLEDKECGEVISSLLYQGFVVSNVHILSEGTEAALKKYQMNKDKYSNDFFGMNISAVVC
ncbi:hypothetical protein [Limnobaculum xujianqingii]|uniref:hypothetical protein n=1 Tax=Limnobaculum xujianqingii TaxID=2738837 RepID=UPI00112D13F0|nr:hypothetical protein [Limnobaculum xujianqingii]